MLPIVDTHQHLWDLSLFSLPWVGQDGPLSKSFLMADYLREAAGLPVAKTVYMEVDVDPEQQMQEVEYVVALCRNPGNPMAGAVVSGRPASAEFPAYLEAIRRYPEVKGVRQVLHGGTAPGFCLTPEFVSGIRLLGETGLSFDICIRADELRDAARLADRCHDTRFILDHCGNASVQQADRSVWERDIAAVAARDNVSCKISGIVASARPRSWQASELAPIVEHCAEVFGPERVLFGGDWPVCTLAATFRQWVEALHAITGGWSEDRRRKLWSENAERVYRV